MILDIIHRDRFIDNWDIIKPLLQKACKRVDEDILSLAFKCLHNPLFLVALYQSKGLLILELTEHSIHCVTLSGEFPDNYEEYITEYMEKLAISCKKTELTLEGRKGWIRKLKHLGWMTVGSTDTHSNSVILKRNIQWEK